MTDDKNITQLSLDYLSSIKFEDVFFKYEEISAELNTRTDTYILQLLLYFLSGIFNGFQYEILRGNALYNTPIFMNITHF